MLMPAPPRLYATGDDELDRLLQPTKFYKYPKDVLTDGALTVSEKRAILSAWVSDACTVASIPMLRIAPWSGTAVTFDEAMDALQKLDSMQQRPQGNVSRRRPGTEASPE